jgi:hypothetical protein
VAPELMRVGDDLDDVETVLKQGPADGALESAARRLSLAERLLTLWDMPKAEPE